MEGTCLKNCNEHLIELDGETYLLTMAPMYLVDQLLKQGLLSWPNTLGFACQVDRNNNFTFRYYEKIGKQKHAGFSQPLRYGSDQYFKQLEDKDPVRCYFALLPLDKQGNADSSLRDNYQDGEGLELGMFQHMDVRLSPHALVNEAPITWDRDLCTICDPEPPGKGAYDLISWIHHNGLLITKHPYFQLSMKDSVSFGYLPTRRELYGW